MTPNTCGCRQCGGPQHAADSLAAQRVAAWAPFVRATHPAEHRNRIIPPSLYSALVLRSADDRVTR